MSDVAAQARAAIDRRLLWASVHWPEVTDDVRDALALAFANAGWQPPADPLEEAQHKLTEKEKELRQWLMGCPNGAKWWLVIKGGFRKSYELGKADALAARVIPSRTTDPQTSRAAEPGAIRAGTQRHKLLEAFGQPAAADGLTDEEAADLADGVPYRSEFAKRCSELRQAGHLKVVPDVTRAGVAGHQRIVSRITIQGRATLLRLA